MDSAGWLLQFQARALVYKLGREADQAMELGNQARCLELIEELYDLTDCQFESGVRLAARHVA